MTYELLAGRLPYDLSGKSIHSALATLMTAEPQPLAELSGPHRKWLERVLGNALQKRPDDRYESVAEFAPTCGVYWRTSSRTRASRAGRCCGAAVFGCWRPRHSC
jgi:serine/threonine protein kinase